MIETKPGELLAPYFDAGYPAIAVETCEERRLIDSMKEIWPQANIWSIAATGGLRDERRNNVADAQADYRKAFTKISSSEESFLVVMDFQGIVRGAAAYRPVIQALPAVKGKGSMIIFVSPSWELPAELKHEIPIIQMPLPSAEELEGPLNDVIEAVKNQTKPPADKKDFVIAARGITLAESENVFSLSAASHFDKAIVEREKMRLVKSVCMSVESVVDPKYLGGLGRFKSYLREEVLPSLKDDQLRIRGILAVGIQGCGKSLGAKVAANILGWPLVRLDISAAKGSKLGQSESQLRDALATADAVAPCVLWVDEVEKGVGGYASSASTDGGTTLGMVGTLLTWWQEHKSPVLTFATCNDFAKLPDEMTRPGRFDERFFFDLPCDTEREEIAKIHLEILGCKLENLSALVNLTADWTPAEIEHLIKKVARRTGRKPTMGMYDICSREIKPISKRANIQALREWAKENLTPANDVQEESISRKINMRANRNAN